MNEASNKREFLDLLIVDNEELILEGLKTGFDWNAMGYNVYGTATNGLKAIKLINEKNPAVILTDITMPQMDGIQLLEWVKKEQLPIKSVVLSGYDDFQFVRSTLLSGASDYLIKPLEETVVYRLFKRIREDVLSQRTQMSDKNKKELILQLSGEDICGKAVADFMYQNAQSSEKTIFILEHYDFKIEGKSFIAAIFNCRGFAELKELTNEVKNHLNRQALFSLLFHQVDDMLSVLIIYDSQKSVEEIYNAIYRFFDYCNQNERLSVSRSDLRFFLSEEIAAFGDIPRVYSNLLSERHVSFYHDFGVHIIRAAAPAYSNSASLITPQEISQSICPLVLDNQVQTLNVALEKYFRHFSDGLTEQDKMTMELIEVYTLISQTIKKEEPDIFCYTFKEICTELSQCFCFQEVKKNFIDSVLSLQKAVLAAREAGPDLISMVRAYIAKNYAQPLSLVGLSKIFYINSTYLSTLFCQRTGVTLLR